MSEDLIKELGRITNSEKCKCKNTNETSDDLWLLMLLGLIFMQPPKPEKPIINIYIGGE